VKALIRSSAIDLLTAKAVAQRVKAAQVLGELGEQGVSARGVLCRAMLDASPDVRVAAADALKNIDPKMHYLAVALATSGETVVGPAGGDQRDRNLLSRIQALEEDAAPLAPLVAQFALQSAAADDSSSLLRELEALSHIGKNDLQVCRLVASGLASPHPEVRRASVQGLARMKHGRLAVPSILKLLRTDVPENRIAAIQTLTVLADGSTEEILADAIARQRYHPDERVRRAVDLALNKLSP
jgi:HEAT repeat protein